MHFSSPHHHLKWRSLMSPLSHLLLLSGSFLFSQCPTIEKQQNRIIGHFRDSFYLCFKTSLGAQPFIWKWVLHLCLLSCKLNSFPYERLCTKTRSETGKRQLGNGVFHKEAATIFKGRAAALGCYAAQNFLPSFPSFLIRCHQWQCQIVKHWISLKRRINRWPILAMSLINYTRYL